LYADSSGNINAALSEADQQLIINESFPDVEIRTFSYSQYGTGVSIDPQSRSFKRYCNHDFGVVFYDERGRPGNVNPLGSAYVDGYRGTQNATGAAFVVAAFDTSQNNIPSWAHHYRMVYAGNSTIDDFIQYSAGGAFVPDASKNNDGLIYVSLNYLQENNLVSYSKAGGAVGADGDKDLYTYSAGDRLRIISYYNNEDDRIFVDEENHSFEVVGTVTLGDSDNPLVGENEDIHPAKKGQFVILKDNFKAEGFSFDDVLNSRGVNAGLDTSDIYDSSTNRWNRRCIFEIYTPTKSQSSEDRVYYEIGKTYNIIKLPSQARAYQTPNVIMTEGDVFFRKSAVNLQKFENNTFLGLIGNGNGESDESIEPRFRSYYLESNTFTDRFPGADVKPFGKPRFISREKKEVTRESSIKFSDKANTESNVVRYTSFNNSKLPFKDLQNNDGPITSLLNFNDSLFCIQQLKCSSIPVARTIFSDALGQETVLGSSKVLGTEKYYAGTYGSSHPESVAHVDNTVYFASSDFNQVYRFSPSQGIEVISGKGMGSFFDSALNVDKSGNNRIVGGYDPETDEFILSVNKDIDTFSNTKKELNQPSGSVLTDELDEFTGSVDFIAGQISDAQIEILVGAVQGFGDALKLEQDNLQAIIEGIGSLQGLLEGDFSAPASEGLSLQLTIGDLTTEIGPFSNPSSYNAALQEIQNTAFVNLDTTVGQVLSSYEQTDDAYDTLIRTIVPSIESLTDQLEVLSALGSQVAELASGGGETVVDTVASILETAGLTEEEQGDLSSLLTLASNAAYIGDIILQAWTNAQLTPVNPQDVIDNIFGSSDIVIPDDFLTVGPVFITYFDDPPDETGFSAIQGDTIGTAIEAFAEQYQFVVTSVGSLDVSGALQELFNYLQTNIADESGVIANLTTRVTQLERELYGDDQVEGGTGDNAGVSENFAALKRYAFGPDEKPIDAVTLDTGLELQGNSQIGADQGLEGDVKILQSQIAQISDGLAEVWDDYAQAYVDIYGDNAQLATTVINGVTYSTEGYTTNALIGYGAQYLGVGYATGINLIASAGDGGDGSNPADIALIAQLQQELAVRADVYNQLVDAYLDPVFKDFDFVNSTTSVVNAYIAEVIDYMRKIIPSDELMISAYEKIYSLIINNVQTVPSNINASINPFINSTWNWSDIDGNPESVNANLANATLSEYKGVILEEMISDLGKIVQGAQSYVPGSTSNNLAGASISNQKNSVNTLTQWFKAYSNIRYSSPEAFDSYFNFNGNVEAFGNQTIQTGGGGLSNFSELINFFQDGQLTAEQVATIIRGFTWNTDNPENLILALDANDDQAVGSQDLLAFLVSYGQPGFDGGTAETVIANLLGFNGAGLGNFPD
jgi:hypothetical protein